MGANFRDERNLEMIFRILAGIFEELALRSQKSESQMSESQKSESNKTENAFRING